MIQGVVFAEGVAAEVVGQVAPDGMDVIGFVLRVVELDEEGGALDAVIVALADNQAARPSEEQLVSRGGLDGLEIGGGQFGAKAICVFMHEFPEDGLLGRSHLGKRQADGIEQVGRAAVGGHDFIWRRVRIDGDLLLRGGEGVDEFKAEAFLGREDEQAGTRADLHFSRIAAEEPGRVGHDFAIDNGEAEGDVVSFPAPTPGILRAGRAKDEHVVVFRVAGIRAARAFEFAESLFEGHDGAGLHETALAQRTAQQGIGEVPFGDGHFL